MVHTLLIIGTMLLLIAVLEGIYAFIPQERVEKSPEEQACIISGGTVKTVHCCKSVNDFPNTCSLGACGCSLEYSHEVKFCDCGDPREKCWNGTLCVPPILNFQGCVNAGYPVMESYPRQCKTPDGRSFTEGEETCVSSNGTSMTLFEAKSIAINSECGDRFKEPYLEFSICNEYTGTWWIDLSIEKSGCNPACVINIETEEASINWRCTGLLG
jgi:hypothetical protein